MLTLRVVVLSLCLFVAETHAFAESETLKTNAARSYAGLRIPHVARQVVSDDAYPDFNVLHHLTGISPYFDSPGVGMQPEPPAGCNVTSAAYLIRHGDIYANDFDYEEYIQPFLWKLGNVSDKSIYANTPLAFLSNWENPIANESLVSLLTPLGAGDAKTFGGLVKRRYPTLTNNITIWSATAERTLDTAENFVSGFGGAKTQEVDEGKNASANSLTPHKSCSKFDAAKGADESSKFRKIYTQGPIKRFNASVPSLNLTDKDIFAMQQLCGYETVIKNGSEFCKNGVFTPNEWLGFEYAQDIMYAYSLGYGLDFSADLGMPWLRASVDMLATNETLPQKLFLSFTHREEPAFAMTALGLFNDSAYTGGNVSSFFPSDTINYSRSWKSSFILPFLGHVALERLTCPSISSSEDFIRILVNSAPIPLPPANLQTGPDGSAPLSEFVKYVGQRAQMYGDFVGNCGDTQSNATNTLYFYQDTLGVKIASSTGSGGSGSNTTSAANSSQNGAAMRSTSFCSMAMGLFLSFAALMTLS